MRLTAYCLLLTALTLAVIRPTLRFQFHGKRWAFDSIADFKNGQAVIWYWSADNGGQGTSVYLPSMKVE